MTNGTQVVDPAPVAGVLNVDGQLTAQSGLALIVLANDDEGTTPTDPTASYIVTEQIDGQDPVSYSVIIHVADTIIDTGASATEGSPIVQLSNVLASAAMVGCVFSGVCAFDGDVTVIDYDPTANTLTVNADAVATVSGSLTICHAVDLSTLAQYEPAPTVQTYIPFNLGQTNGQAPVWDATLKLWVPGSAGSSTVTYGAATVQILTVGELGSVGGTTHIALDEANGVGTSYVAPTSIPITFAAGRTFQPVIALTNIDTTRDEYDIFALFTVTDLSGENILIVGVEAFLNGDTPTDVITVDWSTAEFDVIAGSDLDFAEMDGNWWVMSASGGIYVAQLAVQMDYD